MSLLSPQFTWGWPSIVVEILSGLACDLVALAVLVLTWSLYYGHIAGPPAVAVLVLATAFGLLYEVRFDENGWSPEDFGQRMIGVVFGVLLWGIL